MKRSFIVLLMLFTVMIFGCAEKGTTYAANSNATVTAATAKTGDDDLSLSGFTNIIKGSRTVEEIESKLNEPNGINYTGHYLNVREGVEGNAKVIYAYYDDNGENVDVARVLISNAPDGRMVMNTYGNPNIYHTPVYQPVYYHTSDVLLAMYLYHPHSYWHSSYHYGHYPSTYVSRTRVVHKTTVINKTVVNKTVVNKNVVNKTMVNKSTPSYSAPSVKPTARVMSAKPMAVRSYSKPVATGGFSRSSSSYSSPSKPSSSYSSRSSSSGRVSSSRSSRR